MSWCKRSDSGDARVHLRGPINSVLIMIITGVDSVLENALKLRSAALYTCY